MGYYHHLPSFNYIFIRILIITTIYTIDHMARLVDGKKHFYLKNEIWRKTPVIYRCQSGRSDTGVNELKSGQTLDYSFETYFLEPALYFCHFYFERKDRVLDVYAVDMEDGCSLDRFRDRCINHHIEWVIREDGFYSHCVYFRNDEYCSKPPPTPEPTPLRKWYNW
ncbi:hypothetical protein RND81_03G086600 [Saponaria officinalis]|uniref:S-protein homolog n=1 Tax=Saponaria officinalis TaxID=3572 RepID=A0AAW1M690_SAPOF